MTSLPARPRGSGIDHLGQRSRRAIAITTLAGMPAMFAWSTFWMGTTVPTILWGPVSFLLIGLTIVGAFLIYRYVRGRADLPGAGLDERERQLRDRAWIRSYQVLSSVVIAIVGYLGLSVFVFGRTLTVDAGLVNAAVLCVAVLLPVLPGAALAWLEPDAPADY